MATKKRDTFICKSEFRASALIRQISNKNKKSKKINTYDIFQKEANEQANFFGKM